MIKIKYSPLSENYFVKVSSGTSAPATGIGSSPFPPAPDSVASIYVEEVSRLNKVNEVLLSRLQIQRELNVELEMKLKSLSMVLEPLSKSLPMLNYIPDGTRFSLINDPDGDILYADVVRAHAAYDIVTREMNSSSGPDDAPDGMEQVVMAGLDIAG
jgi:hypothetical protein